MSADSETKEPKKAVKQPEQRALFNQDVASLRPRITVFGVGGAGGNAVNNMIRSRLEGIDFVVANTDSQALSSSLASMKIQLGPSITQGLGAGSRPEVGRASAEEAENDIMECLKGSNMVFITAGMGGGTGTGAGPVVAKMARDQGILTIGVVTKPFHFEGIHRMRTAEKGIDELQRFVDTLIIIPNQNLFRVANEKTTFVDAFKMADDVLRSGVQGITDLMVRPGLINLDFNDICTIMSEMGKAMMGTGDGTGERRALDAAEAAISNPLLLEVSMKGARAVLINITGGLDMTLYEVDEAANRIREEVDPDANIIFGSAFDESMQGNMRVSVVATGIDVTETHNQRAVQDIPASLFSTSSNVESSVAATNVDGMDSAKVPEEKEDDSGTANLDEDSSKQGKKKRAVSFFEKWGFRRKKKEKPHSSDEELRPSCARGKDLSLGVEVDELDIPAFLRRK
ncbi:MAG: cell division protein FtsZ [Holosporales bacterium]|jgi:cell division protein FtsZ|nr:cell division protein FtsZ [Holosporales bacterium]